MSGQFRENYKRLVNKLPATNTSTDDKDIVRFKDGVAFGVGGQPISATPPASGEVLTWDGSEWVPALANLTASGTISLTGTGEIEWDSDTFISSPSAGKIAIGTTSGDDDGLMNLATLTATNFVNLLDDARLGLGNDSDVLFDWSTAQLTAHNAVMAIGANGTGSQGGTLILTEYNQRNKDHGRATSSEVVLAIYDANTDPSVDGTKFLSLHHNGTNAVLHVDSGDLILSTDGSTANGILDLQTLQHTGFIQGTEMTAPGVGAANTARIYFEDNGSGKTRMMVQFATGVAQQIAIEP